MIRLVAKPQRLRDIQRRQQAGIHRYLPVAQLHVRRQAYALITPLFGQLELKRGDDQLVAVDQVKMELSLSFAIGFFSQ